MQELEKPLGTVSMAALMIRAQGEQIREDPAQYVARKHGIRGDKYDKPSEIFNNDLLDP